MIPRSCGRGRSAEKGDEGEKRERERERESYLFHHTTRSLCASVAATLSQGPTGGCKALDKESVLNFSSYHDPEEISLQNPL